MDWVGCQDIDLKLLVLREQLHYALSQLHVHLVAIVPKMVWQMKFLRKERSAVNHEVQDSPLLTVTSLMRKGDGSDIRRETLFRKWLGNLKFK